MGLFETKIDRLYKWAQGDPQPPLSIELVPTDDCNLNCSSCWRQGYTQEELEEKLSDEISDGRLKKIIDEAAEMGVREIIFVGGGEPLTREVLPDLIERIKDYGMEGDLVTNGTLIRRDVAHILVEKGWNRIKFSVDGPDPEVHDELRGMDGAFEKTVDNIKYISDLREKSGKDKPKLHFNTVVSKGNYKKLPEIIKLAGKLGMDGIQLLPTTAFTESGKEMQLNEEETEELMEIIERCEKMADDLGVDENNLSEYSEPKYIEKTESMHRVHEEELKEQFSEWEINNIIQNEYREKDEQLESFKYVPCYAPWHHITIRPNGNIAPCFSPWVWETDVSVKDKRIKELWYGEYFDGFREKMLSRELPDQCKRCCVWEVWQNRDIRKELDNKFSGIKAKVKKKITEPLSG